MIIFNITSAEIKTKSADVLLTMITILKELRIAQLYSSNGRTLVQSYASCRFNSSESSHSKFIRMSFQIYPDVIPKSYIICYPFFRKMDDSETHEVIHWMRHYNPQLVYRIVASRNTCYYSENQIFCFLKSWILTCLIFFLGTKLFCLPLDLLDIPATWQTHDAFNK